MRWASLLLLALACHGSEPAPAAPVPLATTPVEIRRPTGTLTLAGELRPWQQVDLRARLPAYVAERRVEVGDRVARGDLLVALSAPDRVAERAEAEAALGSARARLTRLETAASTEGVVAPIEVEEAQGTSRALDARVRALREVERELSVRAPFPGVITQRGADVGALVGPGSAEPLVTVADTAKLRLVVAVPEAFAASALPGAAVAFRVAGSAEPRQAVVARTAGMLDGATRTLEVEADLENAAGELLPGSYVDVLWPLDTGAERAFVPATAVVRSTEGTWVWVRRGDVLARVDVQEIGREQALVGVRGELAAGDLVVTRGSEDLVAGPWPGGGVP